ncbi:MAG: hypothetical protein QOD62_2186 [Actinomycetota bacterium]|jgi:hypothetical protein|nr:hypothetical protein [Actinomycetota bacterium]
MTTDSERNNVLPDGPPVPDITYGEWPAYRFILPYIAKTAAAHPCLGRCLIEIYAIGAQPFEADSPVVVFTDLPGNPASIDDNIELLSKVVADIYLNALGIEVLGVRWVEHTIMDRVDASEGQEEDWEEIVFHKGLREPTWRATEPVVFDRKRLRPRRFWADRLTTLGPNDVHGLSLAFTEDECHKERTGACSLRLSRSSDDLGGESGFAYCRELGSFASLWHFVRACVPGLESLRPDQREALLEDVDLQARVRREWKPPFGPFPPDIRAFLQRALRLYGPGNDGIHGERVAGTVTITDGRHRSCAAFQQGIGVAAMVAQEQTRLDPMAS